MEAADSKPLPEEYWRIIDQLGETFCESADLSLGLQAGLSILLKTMNRPGGALFIPRFCEHIKRDVTLLNTPDRWEDELDYPLSSLRTVINNVMKTGQMDPAEDIPGLGAAFPILVSQRTAGVLLVSGPAVPADEYRIWKALLRPFGRTIAVHSRCSGNVTGVPTYGELMKSRNTLRAMFDSLPISIYIIDSFYNIAAINQSRAYRVGETFKKLVGQKCYVKLHGRTTPCEGCRVAETFQKGENTQRLLREWEDPDSLTRENFTEWEISTYPIYDEKNNVYQTILVEQDVTEKHNLEANLIQSEKLAAVGQLAAGVAHEINNPLTAIIANAQILQREVAGDNRDFIDALQLIEMAGTRASQVVRNLLGIARKEKFEFEPIDLNRTLQNSLSLVQHELVGQPIKIELDLGENMPPLIASQEQLQGVWINMIMNALDALDKESGFIAISSSYSDGVFVVTVQDNGKGIPADLLSRVFDPFFTTKSTGRGTGLGLSVVARSIRQHGGNIQVESQMGKWTRFTVTLPEMH